MLINKKDSLHKQSNSIKNIRNSFISARNTVSKLDQSLRLIHFIDSILTVSSIMLHIYMTALGVKDSDINAISSTLIFSTVLIVSKLITSCLIHDVVYEESEKLFLTFDELDISVDIMDENLFREALYFKSKMSESKIGFTIAGLVPFKKITLLSVSFMSFSLLK